MGEDTKVGGKRKSSLCTDGARELRSIEASLAVTDSYIGKLSQAAWSQESIIILLSAHHIKSRENAVHQPNG